MEFFETVFFTRKVARYLSDEEYADLQRFLAGYADAGQMIRGGNGLRKLRWTSACKNQGKRGGIRVIYYRVTSNQIYMLDIYGKGEKKDLSEHQLNVLVKHVREVK